LSVVIIFVRFTRLYRRCNVFCCSAESHEAYISEDSVFKVIPALLGAVVLSGVGLGSALPATAAPVIPVRTTPVGHLDIVSDDPVDNTPDVLDGTVNAIVQVGDTVYVGGRFSKVQERGSAVQVPKANIFAFSASTGKLDKGFAPVLKGGGVDDLVPASDGQSMYVSGWFNKVNGQARTQKIARIDLASGGVVASFKSPVPNGRITDVNRIGNTLYVGGLFTQLKGVPQDLVAALDATTGARLTGINLDFAGTMNGGETGIRGMDVSPDGRHLVVVGNFRTVDGRPRAQLAMIDLLQAGVGVLSDWTTDRYSHVCTAGLVTDVRDVAFSPDSAYFVVATSGGSGGIDWLCDAAVRWETDGVGGDQQPTWIEYTGGDTITRVSISESAVYVGGHFRWLNNPYSRNEGGAMGPGAVERTGLAALDPVNGSPFSWNPTRDRGYGVFEFTLTDNGLWMGHDTKRVHNEVRSRLAYFPLEGGTSIPTESTPGLPGTVYILGGPDSDTVRRVTFDGATAGTPELVPSTDLWRRARGSWVINGEAYTFWNDDTVTTAAATQASLGAQVAFPTDSGSISNVTGSFYDPQTKRIYESVYGQPNALYYRSFNLQSRTLGALMVVSEDAQNVDWSEVRGMFVAGGRLYWVSNSNGALHSIGWHQGATVAGTQQVVSGPALDGIDWRGQSLIFTD
jgi:hypothetical protein